MATLLDDGDRYSLSRLDIAVLTALLSGPNNSYQIARQCEVDSIDRDIRVSNSMIQHSIKSMSDLMLIKELEGRSDGPGKPSKFYKVTSIGRQILDAEAASMRHRLDLIRDRTKPTKKRP